MPYAAAKDGSRIHYLDSGGSGPVVVLLHGFGMDAGMFTPQLEALAPDFRVIAIDSRGHGRTEEIEVEYTFWDLARDVAAVLDCCEVRDAVVGGVDQGGMTALRFALQRPSRVRGVVLVGTEATALRPDIAREFRMLLLDGWALGGRPLTEILPWYALKFIGGDPEIQRGQHVSAGDLDRARLAAAARCFIHREDLSVMLGDITVPALLIRGEADSVATDAQMRELAAGLGGSVRYETVSAPTAAHAVTWTHPELTAAQLREFLDLTTTSGDALSTSGPGN